MSKEGLAKVLGHAIIDEDFRKKLKADSENTAKHVAPDLTPEELKFLNRDLDHDSLHAYSKKAGVRYIGPDKLH
jgi:hypothetical protein